MKIELFGKNFDVEILEEKEGVLVRVNGKDFFFKEEEDREEDKVEIPERNLGEEKVLAPISGQVIKIFQKEKAEVKKGDGLLILSAMKMENEILVEKGGTIEKIFVKEEENVKKGDILAIIK